MNNDKMTKLMMQIQKGDESKTDELVKMCVKKLNCIINTKSYKFTPDCDREDFIWRVIEKAVVRYKNTFDGNKASFSTWLNRIATTEYYKICDKRAKKTAIRDSVKLIRFIEATEDGDNFCVVDNYYQVPSAEDVALSNVACENIFSVIEALSERQRDALTYRKVVGLSSVETARVMGCKPGNVDLLVSRGRKSIRDALSREESCNRSRQDSERCIENTDEEKEL